MRGHHFLADLHNDELFYRLNAVLPGRDKAINLRRKMGLIGFVVIEMVSSHVLTIPKTERNLESMSENNKLESWEINLFSMKEYGTNTFHQICNKKMIEGRKKHGDWHPDIPWEWTIWNLIEEIADGINYLDFYLFSNNRNREIKLLDSNSMFDLGVKTLRLLDEYGNPEIVKQLKEGSFKLCPKPNHGSESES